MTSIDEIMSDVQSFASTWALVGGRFDDGSMHNTAEAQSAELRNLIAAALADARRDGAEAMREAAANACRQARPIGGRAWSAEQESCFEALTHVADYVGALHLPTGERHAVMLTDEQIEHGREKVFSTGNPFCPCDAKTMRKAARWAERAVLTANGLEVRRG